MNNPIVISIFYALIAMPFVFYASQFYINEFENRLINDSKAYLAEFRVKSDPFSTLNRPYHKFGNNMFFFIFAFIAGFSFLAFQNFEANSVQLYAFLLLLPLLAGLSTIDYETRWLTTESTLALLAGVFALHQYAGFTIHPEYFFATLGAVVVIRLFGYLMPSIPIGTGDLYLLIAFAPLFGVHTFLGGILIGSALSIGYTFSRIFIGVYQMKHNKKLKPRTTAELLSKCYQFNRWIPFGPFIIIGTLSSYLLHFDKFFAPVVA